MSFLSSGAFISDFRKNDLQDYVFNKLVNWTSERGQDPANPDASAIMQPIAHNLTKQQIAAVAAYLSYLE